VSPIPRTFRTTGPRRVPPPLEVSGQTARGEYLPQRLLTNGTQRQPPCHRIFRPNAPRRVPPLSAPDHWTLESTPILLKVLDKRPRGRASPESPRPLGFGEYPLPLKLSDKRPRERASLKVLDQWALESTAACCSFFTNGPGESTPTVNSGPMGPGGYRRVPQPAEAYGQMAH
jgi:hypothetical protein